MKHARCPTSNRHVPYHQGTKSSMDHPPFSSTPIWSQSYSSILHILDPRGNLDEFQSNGSTDHVSSSSRITGLGIRCADSALHSRNGLPKDDSSTDIMRPKSAAFEAQPSVQDYADNWGGEATMQAATDLSDSLWLESDPSQSLLPTQTWGSELGLDGFSFVPTSPSAQDFPMDQYEFKALRCDLDLSIDNTSAAVSHVQLDEECSAGTSAGAVFARVFNNFGMADEMSLDDPSLITFATPPMATPILDVNMFSSYLETTSDTVNPVNVAGYLKEPAAEETCVAPIYTSEKPSAPVGLGIYTSCTEAHSPTAGSLTDAVNHIMNILSAADSRKSLEEVSAIVDDCLPYSEYRLPGKKLLYAYEDDDFTEDDATDNNVGCPLSFTAMTNHHDSPSRSSKRKTPPSVSACTAYLPVISPTALDMPVLDAHHGVSLMELQHRAANYRMRHADQDIDRKWLMSFVGKLSERGEMLDEYRCYVLGCTQTNKRRDHILIHVGAHVDKRPFKCPNCPSRFLRKNECKRHELSHTGTRPYICNECPLGLTRFVRQDLLKRHQLRVHIENVKPDGEGAEPRRKKVKTT